MKRATGRGAFVGLIAGIAAVAYVATQMPRIAFLWHNVVGVVVLSCVVGVLVSLSPAAPADLHFVTIRSKGGTNPRRCAGRLPEA